MEIVTATAAGLALIGGSWISTRYHIAQPHQFILRTGLGIKNVKISRNAFQWPFQRVTRMNMTPGTHAVHINSMSKEKIAFNMPAVITVGPKDDDASRQLYATLLSGMSIDELNKTIHGIIQGEVRILSGGLHIDEIFNQREMFKAHITAKMDDELSKFGLVVYNTNIEELNDTPGNEYFKFVKKRALEGAVNNARVDVAEAKRKGDTGEKMHESLARQQMAAVEKDAKLVENQRAKEIAESNAELAIKRAGYDQSVKIAQAQSRAAAEQKDNELQRIVEAARREQQIEQIRAKTLSAAHVQAEVDAKHAEGLASATRIQAEAQLYKATREAGAIRQIAEAEASRLSQMLQASGGDMVAYTKWLITKDDGLMKLATANSEALKGLKPKITVWQGAPGTNDSQSPITNLLASLPPLFKTLEEQTGYQLFPKVVCPPQPKTPLSK